MLYHAGVLDGPTSRTLKWIKSGIWGKLPDPIQHDLDVALSTPGFTHQFWMNQFARSQGVIANHRNSLGDRFRDEAVANWNSITADDARALAQLRAAGTRMPVPCRLQMLADIDAGMTWSAAAIHYQVTDETINQIRKAPFGTSLPAWFTRLIPAI